jgi:hypothetical protein
MGNCGFNLAKMVTESKSYQPQTKIDMENKEPVDSRPCKGGEFEILILEAKRQNAGICRSRPKMFATWTFSSIGRRVT